MKKLSFEASIQELEEIVAKLENGEESLEESLKLFQEGTALVRRCGKLLDDAELQIQKVTATDDGSMILEEIQDEADL